MSVNSDGKALVVYCPFSVRAVCLHNVLINV